LYATLWTISNFIDNSSKINLGKRVSEEKDIPENKETSTPPLGNENMSSKEDISSP